jgi:peptide/nickel transport system ATP-binding protein
MSVTAFDVSVATGNRSIVQVQGYPIHENRITFLFGESGIGKSVISKALYGLLDTSGLNVAINGRPYGEHLRSQWTRSVRQNSFFVFQEPSSHLNPLMRITEQLSEGSLAGIDDRAITERLWQNASPDSVRKILDVYPKPYRPSGGEKQRVLLAMAFKRIDAWINDANAGGPTYFVFDEPTGSLDNHYRNLFLRMLFEKYTQKPFTVLIITHDYSIISEIVGTYRNLLDRVRFRELSRSGDSDVTVNDFSPDDYLGWLAKPRPVMPTFNESAPVLDVAPRFSIFGRQLGMFGDSGRTVPRALSIERGGIAYVKAPSGIGKTTLAKIIMGIYRADRMSMILDGIKFSEKTPRSLWASSVWGRRATMVFQHADEALNLASTVRETFSGLPLDKRLTGDMLVSRLEELFDAPVAESFLRKKVAHLSGGQKQRLNLLRSLVLNTGLLILDEPLNGLDFLSVKRVLSLLDAKRANGTALLMISHNEDIFDHFVSNDDIYYLGECG